MKPPNCKTKLVWSLGFVAICLVLVARSSPSFQLYKNTNRASQSQEQPRQQPQQQRLCTRSELRRGQWKPVTLPKPIYVPVRFKQCAGRTGIVSDADARNGSITTAFHTHTWVPNAPCLFAEFRRNDFCKVLGTRTLALMGDSLNTEIFHSLLHQLDELPTQEIVKAHIKPEGQWQPLSIKICRDQATLVYCGTDPLFGKQDTNFTLESVLQTVKPDILFMNRGAHIRSDQEIQLALPQFVKVLHDYYQEQPTSRILWKTTTTGHPNCWEYSQPNHNLTYMVQRVNNQSLYTREMHPQAHTFGWWKFPQQTKLLLDHVEQQKVPMEVVDGYDILLSRPELHRDKVQRRHDCLHHCHPGPHDIFPRLLNHYLHMTRDEIMM